MKFKINDKVKIIKILKEDPNYLLGKTGTIVKIIDGNEFPIEIVFNGEESMGMDEVLWKENELEVIDSEEIILHLIYLQNDRNISDAFEYLKSKGVTPEIYKKLWNL